MKKTVFLLLIAFVVTDLFYSFLQFNQMPLDGDLAESLIPADFVHKLYSDPFGLNVLINQETYPNPNRVFSHLSLNVFMNKMPLFLQSFIDPVTSVYTAGALARILIQGFLILLLAVAISERKSWFDLLLSAAIITPLFQSKGYNRYMGVIDQSITYTFFYALPLAFLVLFFLPFYLKKVKRDKYNPGGFVYLLLAALLIILPFSGPLIPGVVLVISLLFILNSFKQSNEVRIYKLRNIDCWLIGMLGFLSLYSIYIGTYNSSNLNIQPTLYERYIKLFQGLYFIIVGKPGWAFLIIGFIVNLFLIKSYLTKGIYQKHFVFLKWISAFIVLYLILLPLGGYREYRAHIIRYDTISPVTIACIFSYGLTTLLLMKNLSGRMKWAYVLFVVILTFIFTNADKYNRDENICEVNALKELANSNETIVKLKSDCNILSWKRIDDYKLSNDNALLLQSWNITKKKTLYFQE